MKGYLDYGFSNNNSYVYNQMLNYKFRLGMPTLIHTGLQKIIDLYDHPHNDTIFLILITDGETLNVNDYKSTLKMYPFNSTKINFILLKISSTNDNQFVLDELNTSYSTFNCHNNSVEHILNSYNFCSTSTSTSTSITKTDILTSLVPSRTEPNVTIIDTLTSLAPYITNTVSSTTLSITSSLSLTNIVLTTPIPLISNKSLNITSEIIDKNKSNKYIILIIILIIIVIALAIIIFIYFLKKTKSNVEQSIYNRYNNPMYNRRNEQNIYDYSDQAFNITVENNMYDSNNNRTVANEPFNLSTYGRKDLSQDWLINEMNINTQDIWRKFLTLLNTNYPGYTLIINATYRSYERSEQLKKNLLRSCCNSTSRFSTPRNNSSSVKLFKSLYVFL